MNFTRTLVPAMAVFAALTSVVHAETFHSAYSISIWGLPLAKMEFESDIQPATYKVNGSLRSSALADIIEPTRGTITVAGRLNPAGAVPYRYDLNYTYGPKKKRTIIVFKGQDVGRYINQPPISKSKPWIDVTPAHLKRVFDPMSGFLIRANSLNDVCARTISVFDGEVRADIRMSGGTMTSFSTTGYSGPAITCQLKVDPISGYRKGKKQIEYIRNSTNMSLTFAPAGVTGTYAPVMAQIGTQIGTVTVSATRFGG
jgi:hypothetical protein